MSYAITIDEIDDSLDRVSKLLFGIPDGVYRAVGSALKRSAQHGLTVGMKIVSQEYAISQGELKSRTRNINTIVKEYMDAGYVTLVPANHSREKNIALTPAGAAYAQEILEPVYRAEKEAMEQTLAEFSPEFMNAIEALTQNMAQAFQRTIFDRKELE